MLFKMTKHIAINVRDYKKAILSYRDTLGWEVIKEGATETHFVKGDTNFYIEEGAKPYEVFFEYEVEEIEVAKAELLSADCVISQTYHSKSIMFTDAYGMNFHVYEKGTL